jgi:hypothetical protein
VNGGGVAIGSAEQTGKTPVSRTGTIAKAASASTTIRRVSRSVVFRKIMMPAISVD